MSSRKSGKQPRVLYVTYVSPWKPRYGGTLRCYGIIKGLAEYSDLHVAFAGESPNEVHSFLNLADEVEAVRHSLIADAQFRIKDDYRASRILRALLGFGKYRSSLRRLEEALQPDIVWYFETEALRRTRFPRDTPFFIDHCDVRWRKYFRLAKYRSGSQKYLYWLKAGLSRIDEVQLTLRSHLALVASIEEVPLLRPAGSVYCLPNGFNFPDSLPPQLPDSKRFIFFGSLFYEPNADDVRWLCQEVWPKITRHIPDACLDVVGLGHTALGISPPCGVTFHGFEDDLDAMIQQAAALVVPLRIGGGTRIKILEAWAKRLPVISTSVGAEGLAYQNGKTLLLADTAEEFALQCKKCIEGAKMRRSLAQTADFYGRSKYDWEAILPTSRI